MSSPLPPSPAPAPHRERPGRRRILAGGAAVAAGLLVQPALSACGASGGAADAHLRVGAAAPAGGITFDPRMPSPGAGALILAHLYDPLVRLRGGSYEMRLASAAEPNADATVWTVTLRTGATFHDGRPVRAADAAYSLRLLYDPKSSALAGGLAAYVDTAGIRALDARTVRIPLTRARGDFVGAFLGALSTVFPEGTTDFAARPTGSGPFRWTASASQAVRLTANADYWDGPVRLAGLEISRLTDPAARVNAVVAGQLDYAVGISAAAARAHAHTAGVTIHRGGAATSNALLLAMNASLPPFDRPEVRQAVRLAADRTQLVRNVLLGQGQVGNDLVGLGLPGYADGLPQRAHDPDQARSLLTRAGVTSVTLQVAELVPGLAESAQVFVQQARQCGLDVRLRTVSADTYFADPAALRRTAFQTFYVINRPAAVHIALMDAKNAPFNFTGAPASFYTALDAALATVDDARRAQRFQEIQQDFHDHGGDLVWGFAEQTDASRSGLAGVAWSQGTPLFHRVTV